jgi:hypothetical protein
LFVKTTSHYYGATTIDAAAVETASGVAMFHSIDPKTAVKTIYRRLPTNLAQEWRTPPLWGLSDSAPYLHDGRAETVLEAIAQHGGEAEGFTSATSPFRGRPAGDAGVFERLRAP